LHFCLWHKHSRQMVWLIRSPAKETRYLIFIAGVIASRPEPLG
jgi:hypothetical protein